MSDTWPEHIYFVAPESDKPTGGINVEFQFAEILRDHGMAVSLHFSSADYVYPFFDSSVETTFSQYDERYWGKSSWLQARKHRLKKKLSKPKLVNRQAEPGPNDLVIIPEYWYATQVERFKHVPHIILAQDYTGVMMGVFSRIADGLVVPDTLLGLISTSEIAADAVRTFSSRPCAHVPLTIDGTRLSYAAEKKKQLFYFPRKRDLEARILSRLFKTTPELARYETIAVDDFTQEKLQQTFRDSLIFLSLSYREGFGLPPAEAMATGCLVVGYAGVGGDEFMTKDNCFPVQDDNTVALYRELISVIRQYEENPAPLDAFRENASRYILNKYSKENTTAALMQAVEQAKAWHSEQARS